MKKLLLALALALGTLPAIAASATDAIPKHLDAALPDNIRYAHQAAQMETIAYTPVEAPLHYLDAKRQPADKPVKDGYYRKELGKTADGRLVVQHFYQNSDKPASAPFLLKKDAAPDSGIENADGKIVQYQKRRQHLRRRNPPRRQGGRADELLRKRPPVRANRITGGHERKRSPAIAGNIRPRRTPLLSGRQNHAGER